MRTSSVDYYILQALTCENKHQTAQQVYEQVRQNLPAVNPSTVYRALERLVHAGKVSISDMGMGATVYECVGASPHHHLVCQKCGMISTLENEQVQDFFQQVEKSTNFHIDTNHLVLFGLCAYCQDNQS